MAKNHCLNNIIARLAVPGRWDIANVSCGEQTVVPSSWRVLKSHDLLVLEGRVAVARCPRAGS
jgi:hypothetical protein